MGVRMVSGDHVETAKAVARKAGILKAEDLAHEYAVMHSADFNRIVGSQSQKQYDDGVFTEVENQEAFREVARHLRVLARATAADKHLLVVGLKSLGKSVTATGDGINDVEALRCADVGLAMGSGCSAAKEAADLVLLDDDFEAGLRAIMWGRNIYHNLSRFLQFQVTVNLSVLVTIFIGICRFGESPLSAVQLLWINLIMDTFGALALSTEPPLPQVIRGSPFKETMALLSPAVWRQILGVSLWNVIVMVIIMLFGRVIAGLDEDSTEASTGELDAAALEKEKVLRIFTYMFHTFVFLQIFNEINCRKIGKNDFNVFESFFHNWYFIGVIAGTFATQILACHFFPGFTGTVALTRGEWGACIAVGSTVFVAAAILKLTPDAWVARVPTGAVVDEDRR